MLRIFVSYPRVNQRFCALLVELLEAYSVWVDQRLFAGQMWWQEILSQIDRCHVMIFLVSPDALRSRYCMEEFRVAQEKRKVIIPILIDVCDELPEDIASLQSVDMRYGLTVPAVRELFNALTMAERSLYSLPAVQRSYQASAQAGGGSATQAAPRTFPLFSTETFFTDVVAAYERQDYDTVIVLMEEAKNRRMVFPSIDLIKMLNDAKERLEQKEFVVSMEIEYRGIGAMMMSKDAKLRETAMKAFEQFRSRYPDYDPLNLSALTLPMLMPEIRWVPIKAGEVTLEYGQGKARKRITHYVPTFNISKYPITNAQFAVFAQAPDGYCQKTWWNFNQQARQWREKHPEPLPPRTPYGDHPRVNITWYEAMAFCLWLSHKTGWHVTLPTEQQWQWAAQGDKGYRYPWGNRYYRNLCNGQESRINKTTAVGRFTKGNSVFDVADMAGNVWEYTLSHLYGSPTSIERVAKGGSYLSPYRDLRVTARSHVKPYSAFGTVGFRVAINFR
jgi:formylglycine-generating enzyme required for sulfatase activity